jgi:hypothetical protein
LKIIFEVILNSFDAMILKIKNYFDIFLNKNILKNNRYHNIRF